MRISNGQLQIVSVMRSISVLSSIHTKPLEASNEIRYWWELAITVHIKVFIKLVKNCLHFTWRSRDSTVGIAIGYGLDDRGIEVRVPVGSRISLLHVVRPALGSTQSPIQWVSRALSQGVKRPGREADHSPPASVENKKMWIYTSTPAYIFMA
jgi:hypothetical protein